MKIVQFIIDRLIPFISDPSTFSKIRGLVEQADNMNVPGADKKKIVLAQLQSFGVVIGEFVFNTLVELALVYLRSKQGKI